MLAYTPRPQSTAETIDAKLLSSSTMSAASLAVSVPDMWGRVGWGWGWVREGVNV